ncbi:hypothetical protein ES319_1Z181600v1 [Gossypium barbadense]|uniref:Secreted protein n=1 Tax=Gossypium barbadense TaxID=3634 RepID=A0A5J5NE49_GOSBA|nr:hypothetical protein ES319_1Z181600v1 [Gossypium barbadense]
MAIFTLFLSYLFACRCFLSVIAGASSMGAAEQVEQVSSDGTCGGQQVNGGVGGSAGMGSFVSFLGPGKWACNIYIFKKIRKTSKIKRDFILPQISRIIIIYVE